MKTYLTFILGVMLLILAPSFINQNVIAGPSNAPKKVPGSDDGLQFVDWSLVEEYNQFRKQFTFLYFKASYQRHDNNLMEQDVFSDKDLALYFNNNFICSQVELNDSRGIGGELRSKFQITSYPAFVFIDLAGNPVSIHQGEPLSTTRLLDIARDVNSNRTINQSGPLNKVFAKFLEGSLTYSDWTPEMIHDDPAKFLGFLHDAKNVLSADEALLNKFVNSVGDEFYTTNTGISFLQEFSKDANSVVFKKMVELKDDIVKYIDHPKVNKIIKDGILAAASAAANAHSPREIDNLKRIIAAADLSDSEAFTVQMLTTYYKAAEDWIAYEKTIKKYVESTNRPSSDLLNEATWNLMVKFDNKSKNQTALKYIKMATNVRPSAKYKVTYSAVLYKLGKKKKAIKELEKATASLQNKDQTYKEIAHKLKNLMSSGQVISSNFIEGTIL